MVSRVGSKKLDPRTTVRCRVGLSSHPQSRGEQVSRIADYSWVLLTDLSD